jgi:hypothetical protein
VSSRESVQQQSPRGDLRGFPAVRLAPQRALHRAHSARRGPWWFSSGGGRFDLPAPRGTCYLATTALAAVRERLGPVLGGRSTLPAAALADVVVSRLTLTVPGRPGAVRLANLRVQAAIEHGVTRELEVMVPYDVPTSWARAFAAVGLDGVRYGPRFTPGSASSIALFGDAGEDLARPVDPAPVAASAVPGAPRPVPVPRRAEITVLGTPRRRRPPGS